MYLYGIGSLGALAGVLMVVNGGVNLTIRDANPDQEMTFCNKKSSDVLEVLQGVLIMIAAFLLVFYSNCFKQI